MVTHSYRVAVFIDWQNVYRGAREAFGMTSRKGEHGNFSPYQLAQILASGNDRGHDGTLVGVEVHRGQPSSSRDPVGYGASRRQANAWEKESKLVASRPRQLRYRDNGEAEEKGVDVQLALSAVEHTLTDKCEVAIIFSHDSDFEPALETISRLTSASHVESAAWTNPPRFRKRIPPKPGVYHHYLDERVFRRVATPINYAYRGRRAS